MRQARIPYNRVSRHKVRVKQPFTASRQRETGRSSPERSDAGSFRTMEPPRRQPELRCPSRNGTRFESIVRNRSDRRSVPKVPLDKKRRNISTGNGARGASGEPLHQKPSCAAGGSRLDNYSFLRPESGAKNQTGHAVRTGQDIRNDPPWSDRSPAARQRDMLRRLPLPGNRRRTLLLPFR